MALRVSQINTGGMSPSMFTLSNVEQDCCLPACLVLTGINQDDRAKTALDGLGVGLRQLFRGLGQLAREAEQVERSS